MNTHEIINLPKRPDKPIDLKKEFNIQSNMQVKGFTSKTKWVPEIDHAYVFDKATTLSILAGFQYNRRVIIQGYHGTGKSTHIEQVADTLNKFCHLFFIFKNNGIFPQKI